MNKKRTPAEAEAYGGSIDGIGKDNTYLSNIQILGESFEGEKLIELINSKKRYIKTIDNPAHARMLQREILFLQNEILPIVLNESTLLYNEIVKYVTNKVRKAIEAECNVMVMVIELSPTTDNSIRIGTVTTGDRTEGVNIIIDGNGRKTEEVQL